MQEDDPWQEVFGRAVPQTRTPPAVASVLYRHLPATARPTEREAARTALPGEAEGGQREWDIGGGLQKTPSKGKLSQTKRENKKQTKKPHHKYVSIWGSFNVVLGFF